MPPTNALNPVLAFYDGYCYNVILMNVGGVAMEVNINGVKLYCAQIGQGIPVLFVHGYPLDHTLWQPQIDALADVAHAIAPDLRGFGQSDAPGGVYTMDIHADDLAALLDVLQIDRVVLCGLSMGGYVALAFWRKYASRVRGLILVDTRAGADAPVARKVRLDVVEQVKQRGTKPAADAMLPRLLSESTRQSRLDLVESVHAMMLRQPPNGIIGAQLGMAERPDSTATLPTITVPTLIVFGADDAIISAETEGQSLAATIPGAKLVVIPNAGHLSNLEQPETFNVAVREFLSKNLGE